MDCWGNAELDGGPCDEGASGFFFSLFPFDQPLVTDDQPKAFFDDSEEGAEAGAGLGVGGDGAGTNFALASPIFATVDLLALSEDLSLAVEPVCGLLVAEVGLVFERRLSEGSNLVSLLIPVQRDAMEAKSNGDFFADLELGVAD